MDTPFEGGCSCGAVRYRLVSAPMFVHCCHCKNCQRLTGSAFAVNALIETGRLEVVSGAPEPVAMSTGSGQPNDIYRCPACKIAVWSDFRRLGVMCNVRVGTLDRPSALRPDVHIFTRSKLPWVMLPDDVPAFEAFYDVKSVWPPEALARRAAVLGPG